MNIIKSEISQTPDTPLHPADDGTDDLMKKRKRKIYLWAILWAIFPPVLIFVMLAAVIRPAIKGREPSGINYILWILSLILMAAIFQLPFGSFSTISDALKKPEVCRAILFTDWLATIISILLIVLTFRSNLTTPYVPMKKFKIDTQLIFFWLLSLLPLFRSCFKQIAFSQS